MRRGTLFAYPEEITAKSVQKKHNPKRRAGPPVEPGKSLPGKATKEERFLHKVMAKMFSTVGKVYTPEETGKPDWYLTSSWTADQEQVFKEYLVREIMRDFGMSRRHAVKEAGWFLLLYGWQAENASKHPTSASGDSERQVPDEK